MQPLAGNSLKTNKKMSKQAFQQPSSKRRLTGKMLSVFVVAVLALMASCKETNNDIEEYPDWKNSNATRFETLYNQVRQKIAAGDTQWKLIKSFTKDQQTEGTPTDYVIARVISEGTGERSPLFTDTVRVDYRGRLLPSTTHPDGLVFDQTWIGDYRVESVLPSKLAVDALVNGFSTALMKMKEGDRWEIYIPQNLAYGSMKKTGIPAYSTLVFDLTLRACYSRGVVVPAWKIGKR